MNWFRRPFQGAKESGRDFTGVLWRAGAAGGGAPAQQGGVV